MALKVQNNQVKFGYLEEVLVLPNILLVFICLNIVSKVVANGPKYKIYSAKHVCI